MDPIEAYEWMIGPQPVPPNVTGDPIPGTLEEWRALVANPAWKYLAGVVSRSKDAYIEVCVNHNGLGLYRAQGAVVVLRTLDNLAPSVIEQKLAESKNSEEYQNV